MLVMLLRAARITRYLPWFRGIEYLRRFYARVLPFPKYWALRIDDFDRDLKLDVDIRKEPGTGLWHRPELYDKAERRLLDSFLRPDCVFLDVGANIGVYTLIAAKRGARVFAIEADPNTAAILRHHVEINGFADRVTIVNCAATDKEGAVTFFRNPVHLGGAGISEFFVGKPGLEEISIPGRTIDSLNLPPIDVCKMDIEGAESLALKGMRDTIARSPDLKLLIEYNPVISDPRTLWETLQHYFRHISEVGGRAVSRQPSHWCNLWASQSQR